MYIWHVCIKLKIQLIILEYHIWWWAVLFYFCTILMLHFHTIGILFDEWYLKMIVLPKSTLTQLYWLGASACNLQTSKQLQLCQPRWCEHLPSYLGKYIFIFWQVHFEIWTNTFWYLDKCILKFWQIYLSLSVCLFLLFFFFVFSVFFVFLYFCLCVFLAWSLYLLKTGWLHLEQFRNIQS